MVYDVRVGSRVRRKADDVECGWRSECMAVDWKRGRSVVAVKRASGDAMEEKNGLVVSQGQD